MPLQLRWLLAGILALAGWSLAPSVSAQQELDQRGVESLWIDLGMGPEFVDLFNQAARPGDIARIDHLALTGLLDEVTVGQSLVVFKSIAEAEEMMPALAGKVDIIGYNIEHGPANAQLEQAAPVESVKRMRELADRYGAQLAVGPDHDFAVSDGVGMASYADIMILQVQRVQDEPQTVREFVLPLARAMRQANPDIEISIQIGANGDVGDMTELIRGMADDLDGVSILTDHESTDFVAAFILAIRGDNDAQRASAIPIAIPEADSAPDAPVPAAAVTLPQQDEEAAASSDSAAPGVAQGVDQAENDQSDALSEAVVVRESVSASAPLMNVGSEEQSTGWLAAMYLAVAVLVTSLTVTVAIYMRNRYQQEYE